LTAAASAYLEWKPRLYNGLRGHYPHVVAQVLTLKILNILLSRRHQNARDTHVLSRPIGLIVDPTNVCQLACPGCVHSERNEQVGVFDWPKRTLPKALFGSLLARYGPQAIEIYLCNYGEPLLNLATPDLIRQAKRYLLRTSLSTSLSVERFDAAAYVESGLDRMEVSIDGATQSTYARFRRHGDLELVFRNVRRLVETKRELNRSNPTLSWRFLAFQHNIHELSAARKQARELSFDYFCADLPFDVSWDDSEIRPARIQPRIQRLRPAAYFWNRATRPALACEQLNDDVIGAAFDAPPEPIPDSGETAKSQSTCPWLYKNMVLDGAGRVLPCCAAPAPGRNLVFGQFGDGTDAFNSPAHKAARAYFATGDIPGGEKPFCIECPWTVEDTNIGATSIRQYFSAAGATYFDRWSLDLLAKW
jgi:MoaA/NifB/PqqE/SkfB family radical SAM enzyme